MKFCHETISFTAYTDRRDTAACVACNLAMDHAWRTQMKSLENLVPGNTFKNDVKQAVSEAVAEATARGLPKAYELDFSQSQSTVALAKENQSCHKRITPVK